MGKGTLMTWGPYYHWVVERSRDIKLPFIIDPPAQPPQPEPTRVSLKEVDELRATIMRFLMREMS